MMQTKIKQTIKKAFCFMIVGSLTLSFLCWFNASSTAIASSGANLIPGTELTETQKQIALNKPGTVFITTYVRGEMVIQASANYPALSGKGYSFEAGITGSGFVISPDGYILTNGHVVKFTDDQLYQYAATSATIPLIKDIAHNEMINTYGYIPSDQEIEQLLPAIFAELGGQEAFAAEMQSGFRSGEIKLMDVQTDTYVQTGVFLSGKKIPIEQGLKAEIKKVDFDGITDTGEVRGKDIALIKVPSANMPTVTLGDSSVMQVGQQINIIGYPGVATFAEFLDSESSMEPTVTSGVISAKKKMKDGTDVLQTDAAVTHGNSGGPAFSITDGTVIGIASMVSINTQGIQQSGFNYLRPINVGKEFVAEAGVINEESETDKHYRKGLELFWNKKYTPAIAEFQIAKNLYPALIGIQDYITAAETAKSQGLEVAISEGGKSFLKIAFIMGGIFLFLVVVAVVVVIIIVKKGKDNNKS